ncbi:MAG: TlpA family protein disulfide reductase [Gemmatimonadaceae bacterium]|nr:TlpA family protein disulfide reductase [Gemmatimonadaceae bacterium]
MTVKQQWILVLGVVTVLVAGGMTASRYLQEEPAIRAGSDAPGFLAKTLDETPVTKSLTDYRGEVILLNIWATWCIPCRTEMPSMQALHQALGPAGLKIVAVSVDQPGMEQEIREFVRDFKLTFETLYDETGAIQSIYRSAGVPETFLISRSGEIRKKMLGPDDWNSEPNRTLIRQLLAEPKP